MPTRRNPRHGSLQYWPRKRAKKDYPRIGSWVDFKNAVPLAFAGYKVGMTHIIFEDKRANQSTKNEKVRWPVTVIECPPLTIHSARFYKKIIYGQKIITEILNEKSKKHLKRKIVVPKSIKKKLDEVTGYDDIRISLHTNPHLTGFGKKKPEIFEVALGGSKEDKLNYVKENLGKDITIQDILKEGQQTDVHSITTGKGYQGVVKRFGVSLRSHKSEKSRRAAVQGSEGYGKVLYTAPKGGKMGFHQRTHYNKLIVKINDKPEDVNPKGGFIRYGDVKNSYMLIKGSIPGPNKRFAIFTYAIRPNKTQTMKGVNIFYTSLESRQRR